MEHKTMEANFTLTHANDCPFLPCDKSPFLSRMTSQNLGTAPVSAQSSRDDRVLQPYF
jgi:hypothetical protein